MTTKVQPLDTLCYFLRGIKTTPAWFLPATFCSNVGSPADSRFDPTHYNLPANRFNDRMCSGVDVFGQNGTWSTLMAANLCQSCDGFQLLHAACDCGNSWRETT